MEAWDRARSRDGRDVTWGFVLGLDTDRLTLPAQDDRLLRVESVLCCSGGVKQRACYTLEKFDATGFSASYARFHGMFRVTGAKHFWSFCPDANRASGFFGHVPRLEVHFQAGNGDCDSHSSSGRLEVEEEVGTAEWNSELPSTILAPLTWVPENDFGDKPFESGVFEGSIAFIRRGGSCGFAEKVLAAQAAGALGCIIYRDDSECVSCMSRTFRGQEHSRPDIPAIIVDAEVSRRLKSAVAEDIRVRIVLDRSREVMRQLSPEFKTFQTCAAQGEPIHLAVLVEERVRD